MTDLDTTNPQDRKSTARPTMVIRFLVTAALSLPLLFLSGCKKESTPPVEVTVQAEHPEQGPISEHITVDAILAPLAQAAIEPKITAPVQNSMCSAGRR